MQLQLEISIVFGLLLCTAAQREKTRRRRAVAGHAIAGQSDKDTWREDLLKYDFENRMWDVSGISDNSVDDPSETYDNASERYKAKKHAEIAKNGTSKDAFLRQLGRHDLLAQAYSKKVNDYYVNTQWEYDTTEDTSQFATTNQYAARPIFGLLNIDPMQNNAYISLYQPEHKQPHSKEYIHPENSVSSVFVHSDWHPSNFLLNKENSNIPQTSDLNQNPDTLLKKSDIYNKYTENASTVHVTSQPANSRHYTTQRIQHNFTPKQHYLSTGQDSSHLDQYNTAGGFQHNTFNSPGNSHRQNYFDHTKHKTRVKQDSGAYPKQIIGQHKKQNKPPHRKQNSFPHQVAQSGSLVHHYHASDHRPKLPFRHPPSSVGSGSVGLFSRLLKPLLLVGGILLVGTLSVLGYLIWLTPPTIVTYSKRQRGAAGADLLAAPFELSRLTELAARLSQALAEAELVALKLSSGGERAAERWRRCQPLQLCRALVEGAVVHHQPVWSRYIRAAPWLWLFGLDPDTAARLQELARRPGFRSCRPFFKPCAKS